MITLHREVEKALNRVVHNHERRATIRRWLVEIETRNQTVTHGILAGIHNTPAPITIAVSYLGQKLFVPEYLLHAFDHTYGFTSSLDWGIETLSKRAARKGELSASERKSIERFFRYKHHELPHARWHKAAKAKGFSAGKHKSHGLMNGFVGGQRMERFRNANRAVTRAMLEACHKVPPPFKHLLSTAGNFCPLVKPVCYFLDGADFLEWMIEHELERAARNGTLTAITEKRAKAFLSYKYQ